MSYQLTDEWPRELETGAFVNPDTNERYLAWLAAGNIPAPATTASAVPLVVTMRQARLALLDAGLLDAVQLAFDVLPAGAVRRRALLEWEYSATVERNSPLVASMRIAAGLTNEQMDALFAAAAVL